MSIETTITEKIDETIAVGAALLPAFFSVEDIVALQRLITDIDLQATRVPRFGTLIETAFEHLNYEQQYLLAVQRGGEARALRPTTWLSYADLVTRTGDIQEAHTDSEGRIGISMLVPVLGPRAKFYYSSKPFMLPFDQFEVGSLEYGVGDVLLLRQQIKVASSAGPLLLEQIYHAGQADGDRKIRTFDIHVHYANAEIAASTSNDNNSYPD